jgi:Tol biopolymer transport system component
MAVPAFIAVLVAGAAASFLRARSKRGAECVGDAPLFAYTVSAPRLRQTDVAVLGREEVVRATEDQLSEDPSFSPDGTRIVFSSGRDGNFHPELGYERRALFTASSGGGEERRLTRGPYDAEPDWSPDGSAVFVRFRYGGRRDYESLRELRTVELWTVDIETREEQLLLRAPPRRGDAYRLYSPVWSPDGRRIAFSRATPAAHTLWLMDRDGSNVQQISEDIGSSYFDSPALDWSPDGHALAFQGATEEGAGVVVMDLGDRRFRLLDAGRESPAWSPGGSRIAYFDLLSLDRGTRLTLQESDGGPKAPIEAGARRAYVSGRELDWACRRAGAGPVALPAPPETGPACDGSFHLVHRSLSPGNLARVDVTPAGEGWAVGDGRAGNRPLVVRFDRDSYDVLREVPPGRGDRVPQRRGGVGI